MLASNMPLQCCQARAVKVALVFVVVGHWAAEVIGSHCEVQVGPALDLAAVVHLITKRFKQNGHSLVRTKADSGCMIICAASAFFLMASDSGRSLAAACAVAHWALTFSKGHLELRWLSR